MNRIGYNEFEKVYTSVSKNDNYFIKKWLDVTMNVLLHIHAKHTFLFTSSSQHRFTKLMEEFVKAVGSDENLKIMHEIFDAIFMFLYMSSVDEKEENRLIKLKEPNNKIYEMSLSKSTSDIKNILNNQIAKLTIIHMIFNLYNHILDIKTEENNVDESTKSLSEYFYNVLTSNNKDSSYNKTSYFEFEKYKHFSVNDFDVCKNLDDLIVTHYSELSNLKVLIMTQKYQSDEIKKLKIINDKLTTTNNMIAIDVINVKNENDKLIEENNKLIKKINEMKSKPKSGKICNLMVGKITNKFSCCCKK